MTERRLIENSDRGITLNKTLAWAVLTAIVSGSFWVGATVMGLQTSSENMLRAVDETRVLISTERQAVAGLEARVRAVEVAQASQSSDLRSIQIGISRIEASLLRMQDRP